MEFRNDIYQEADRILKQLYQYYLSHGIEFPIKQINENYLKRIGATSDFITEVNERYLTIERNPNRDLRTIALKDMGLSICFEELEKDNNDLFRAYVKELKTIVEKAETEARKNLKQCLSDENKFPLAKSREFSSLEAMRRFLVFLDRELHGDKGDYWKENDIHKLLKYSEAY